MSMRRNRDIHRPMKFHEYISADKSDPRIKKHTRNINQIYNKFVELYNNKKLSKKRTLPKKSYTIGRFTVDSIIPHEPIKKSKMLTAKHKSKKPNITTITTRKTEKRKEKRKEKRYDSSQRRHKKS